MERTRLLICEKVNKRILPEILFEALAQKILNRGGKPGLSLRRKREKEVIDVRVIVLLRPPSPQLLIKLLNLNLVII